MRRKKIKINKAGYTANTSRGRVAGAEMRVFALSNLIITYGPADGRTDGWMDKASHRVACPQLKSMIKACAFIFFSFKFRSFSDWFSDLSWKKVGWRVKKSPLRWKKSIMKVPKPWLIHWDISLGIIWQLFMTGKALTKPWKASGLHKFSDFYYDFFQACHQCISSLTFVWPKHYSVSCCE